MRAIHETGTEGAAGALRPRLGSLFEPSAASVPAMPAAPSGEVDEGEVERQPRTQPAGLPRSEQTRPDPGPVSPAVRLQTPVSPPLSPRQTGETAPAARSPAAGGPPASLPFVPPPLSRIPAEHITEMRTVGPIPVGEPGPESPRSRDFKESHSKEPEDAGSRAGKIYPAELPRIPSLVQVPTLLTRPENPPPQKETGRTSEPGPISESPARERVIPEHILITRQEMPPGAEGERGLVPARSISEWRKWEDAQRGPERGAAQPPTIHVTIGRIEVKASSSGPASKSGLPKPAGMSLEEYLRRRQGGSR